MATCTVVFTSNTDGTITVTSTSAAAQTANSHSLTKVSDVAKGWVFQALGVGLN
jgi:hydroxymethylpyrimidine/phosphomethylpyrimidine kinase